MKSNRNGQTCHYCEKAVHFVDLLRQLIPEEPNGSPVYPKIKYNNSSNWGLSTDEEIDMDYQAIASITNVSKQPKMLKSAIIVTLAIPWLN